MSKIDPELQLHIKETHEKLLEKTDKRYAIKLVERVVFGLVTLILTSVIVAIVALVIR